MAGLGVGGVGQNNYHPGRLFCPFSHHIGLTLFALPGALEGSIFSAPLPPPRSTDGGFFPAVADTVVCFSGYPFHSSSPGNKHGNHQIEAFAQFTLHFCPGPPCCPKQIPSSRVVQCTLLLFFFRCRGPSRRSDSGVRYPPSPPTFRLHRLLSLPTWLPTATAISCWTLTGPFDELAVPVPLPVALPVKDPCRCPCGRQ